MSGYSEKKALQKAQEFDTSLPQPEPAFPSIQEEIERVGGEIKRRFPYLPPLEGQPNETELALSSILRRVRQLGVQIELRVPECRDKSIAMKALEDVYLRSYRAFF